MKSINKITCTLIAILSFVTVHAQTNPKLFTVNIDPAILEFAGPSISMGGNRINEDEYFFINTMQKEYLSITDTEEAYEEIIKSYVEVAKSLEEDGFKIITNKEKIVGKITYYHLGGVDGKYVQEVFFKKMGNGKTIVINLKFDIKLFDKYRGIGEKAILSVKYNKK